MANRVMTAVEGHVPTERWADFERTFMEMNAGRPSALIDSFLVQGIADPTLWRLVGVWHSREAFEAYRASVTMPGAAALFRSIGVEPDIAIFEIKA
ncbi:MAG: hypothetical protein KGO05_03670 [Chloroflexota bacterium]|nr:hypothetical protein [Chloroflexota bacterium]